MGARKNGTCKGDMRGKSLRRTPRSFLPPTRVLSRIYRLLPSGRRPKLPRGVQRNGPPEIFEMNTRWDAICCILRHNFEKCYSVRTDLIASGWFFWYSFLYSVMLTIFSGGSWAVWGEGAKHNLTMASIIVHGPLVCKKPIRFTLQKFPYGTCLSNEFELLQSNHQIFVGTQWELACVESVFFLSWKLEVEKKERKL